MAFPSKLRRIFKNYYWYLWLVVIFIFGYFLLLTYAKYTDNQAIYLRISKPFKKVKKLSDVFYLNHFFKESSILEYELIFQDKDFKQLNENLPDIYVDYKVLLTDEYKKYEPAIFKYKGKEYKVQVRYRGDTLRHWAHEKKSMLIKFDDENLFFGKKGIHLIVPEARYFLVEEMNYHRARKFGLMVPETKFVNLKINGSKNAVYWEAEDIDKIFFERVGSASDANLYVTKDLYSFYFYKDIYKDIIPWRKEVENKNTRFDDYSDLGKLMDLINQEDLLAREIYDIIDQEKFLGAQKVGALAASNHWARSNSKIYSNPISGRFEFILWNTNLYPVAGASFDEFFSGLVPDDDLTLKIFENPEFYKEFKESLGAYLSDESNLQDDLDFYDEKWAKVKTAFYQDRLKNKSNFEVAREVAAERRLFIDNFYKLKELLAKEAVISPMKLEIPF